MTTTTTADLQKKLRKMFVRDEGLRLKPYRCTAGKLTIACGRNLDDVGISEQEAYTLLDNDVAAAEMACRAIFGVEQWTGWSENRRLGWLNLAFNLGATRLLGFRNTLKYAMAGDWPQVEKHLRDSLWAKQVGTRSDRVIALICREEFPYG